MYVYYYSMSIYSSVNNLNYYNIWIIRIIDWKTVLFSGLTSN